MLHWLSDPILPGYVRAGCREALEEVLAIESVPLEVRSPVGRLRAVLLLWSWLYYQGRPEVTDEYWNAAYVYVQRREGRYPELVTPLSPSQRVGSLQPPE